MGCNGSKAGAASLEKAQQLEGDFKITLERTSDDQALGLSVTAKGPDVLDVEAVKEEGLLVDFHKANANAPEQHVKVGDCIIAVNGVTGGAEKMKAELSKKTVVLLIHRPSAEPQSDAAKGTSATTVAAADTAAAEPQSADTDTGADTAAETTAAAKAEAASDQKAEEAATEQKADEAANEQKAPETAPSASAPEEEAAPAATAPVGEKTEQKAVVAEEEAAVSSAVQASTTEEAAEVPQAEEPMQPSSEVPVTEASVAPAMTEEQAAKEDAVLETKSAPRVAEDGAEAGLAAVQDAVITDDDAKEAQLCKLAVCF